jgi:division protein CdvB (Snf7/Vps24/ESCRT-III family)
MIKRLSVTVTLVTDREISDEAELDDEMNTTADEVADILNEYEIGIISVFEIPIEPIPDNVIPFRPKN